MRIIAGDFGSRRIAAPEGEHTRPTPEKAREAVFSMLQAYIEDARVLDIFAGSGAMGLEALSRGAESAVFIDNNKAAGDCVQANISALGLEARARLLRKDFSHALPALRESFDLVFMDPPYGKALELSHGAAALLRAHRLLAEDALVLIEHEGTLAPPEGFALYKEKQYGRAHISLFREA